MQQRLSRFKQSAAPAVLALLFCCFANALHAQWNTPTINGTIATGEYGVHSDGENQQTSGSQTWYVTWDDDNLYFGITNANTNEAAVIYIDTNPIIPINGGGNADGTIVGQPYDGTNFDELPFRANVAMYVRGGGSPYREYRLSDGSGGWGTNITGFGSFAETGGNTREFSFPWSAVGGRPASFAWFGYLTSSGGFVYGQVPTENAGGNIGTSARYSRYYIVNNTGNGTSTKPFARNSYVFNSTTDITDFGAITVYDFTMNTANRSITRASDGSSWTINGALRIYQGTVNFGFNTGSCTVNDSIAIASGGTLTLSNNANALTANGHFRVNGTLNPGTSTVTFSGTGSQNLSGTGLTFYNLVINNAGTSTTDLSGYTRTNPTNITGSITVNNNMEIRRGVVAFCTETNVTFNHNIQGNLVLGSISSEVTISLFQVISNTEFVINHAKNSNVTLTVNGDFLVPAGLGGVTAAITSPTAIGGSAQFIINGNVNAVDTLIFSMNGRVNSFTPPSNPPPSPITMNVGTAGGSGDFIMSNYGNVFLANSSGTTVPTLNLLGGTTSSPAIFDVKFAAVDSNFLILGSNGNGNTFININGVYRVAPGASLWASDRPAIRTTINGRLIVPDNAEICSVNDGIGGGSPILGFGPNGVLVVEDLQGLGDGTSTTPFAFCINRRTGQGDFNLTQISTTGTIEYAATTAGTQIVTPRTYNILRINRTTPLSNFVAPSTFNNPCVATGNITANTLQVLRGVFALTNSVGTFTHSVGTLELGSSTSSTNVANTNTGLFVNKDNGATSTLTVTGNTTVLAGSVSLTLSATGTSITGTTLNLNGNLNTGTNTLWLSGHTSSGSPTTNINLRGNVTLSSTSRFNANPTGTVTPTVTLGEPGFTRTFDVQSVSLLGTPPAEPANVRCNWVIPANATVVLPNNSAIAVMGGFNLTVNGTLECQNDAELISTFTGSGSGNPTLIMGTNGTIRVADVDGLGDGTLINGVDNTLPPNPATLFFRQRVPGASPVPNNWDLSAINTAGTIEYNGTGQTVTPRNGSDNYFNLVFSGGNKTLGGNVDATNSLALNGGIITTGTNDLTLTNASATSLTHTNGHINGRLVRAIGTTADDYFYPIGDASVYRPITLTCGASTSASLLHGEVISGNANSLASVNLPLQSVSFLRYYQFTNTGANPINVTELKNVQVSNDDGVGSFASNTSLRLSSRTTGSWVERALTAAPNTTSLPIQISSNAFPAETITASGGNYFVSLATTSLGDNPLPVELLSFTATSTAQGVRLAWETASEHESRGFTLLRKKQGESAWIEVASYQTDNALRAHNSLNGASYTYTDKTPLEVGKVYEYQLRETGFDGQVTTLQTLTLTIRFNVARAFELAQNYPNPFNPTTTIRYQIPTAETVSLKVYDVLGKEVATLVSGRQEAGSYAVEFNAAGFSSGVYFYRLQAGGFVETKKMMLVK
jgi:hypothetical protein